MTEDDTTPNLNEDDSQQATGEVRRKRRKAVTKEEDPITKLCDYFREMDADAYFELEEWIHDNVGKIAIVVIAWLYFLMYLWMDAYVEEGLGWALGLFLMFVSVINTSIFFKSTSVRQLYRDQDKPRNTAAGISIAPHMIGKSPSVRRVRPQMPRVYSAPKPTNDDTNFILAGIRDMLWSAERSVRNLFSNEEEEPEDHPSVPQMKILRLWTPSRFTTYLFCWFSPIQYIILLLAEQVVKPEVALLYPMLLCVAIGFMLTQLVSAYAQKERDHLILYSEASFETTRFYNHQMDMRRQAERAHIEVINAE